MSPSSKQYENLGIINQENKEDMIESKVLKTSLDLVESVLSRREFIAVHWPFDAWNINLIHEGRKMNMTFEALNNEMLDDAYKGSLTDLFIEKDDIRLKIPKEYVWFNCPLQIHTDAQQMSLAINELCTVDFNAHRETFLRVFQPIERFDLYHDIHTFGYREGNNIWTGRMEIELNSLIIDVFPYDYNKQKYIVFESKSAISAIDFSNKIFSICVALSLISRKVWMDEAFTIEYKDENFNCPMWFRYQKLRPTIHGTYSIFSTNIHSLEDSLNRSENTKYAVEMLKSENGVVNSSLIDWLQPDFISSLCSLLDSNDSLRRSVIMLMEGSTFPVEYQASMYCVVLETMTAYIKRKRGLKDKVPIPKDVFKNRISSEFNKVLDELETEYSDLKDNIGIIRNKINYLNAPTILDKLSLPFEMCGYTLTKREIQTIKNRNKFLHGSMPDLDDGEDEFDVLFNTSLLLHKLCCILILKEAGFNSYILNNPVLYRNEEACQDKEPPVIELKD